jgi:carboxypeptidase family protein
MSGSTRLLAAALVACLCGAMLASCEKTPTAPTSPSSAISPASLQSLRIDGPSLLTPGATAQYIAIGGFSDGATRDVTASTTWLTSNGGVLTIAAGGRATAATQGQSVLAAVNGPSRASFEVLVLRPGTFRLTGTVSDDGLPIADATVEVIDGSRMVMSTRSDASGVYRLFGVSGNIEVRASKEGYAARVNHVAVSDNSTSDFVLSPTLTDDLSGTYTLTITASSSCAQSGSFSLPPDVRTRRYTSEVRQNGRRLTVTRGGASLQNGSFTGQVEGDRAVFDIHGIDVYFQSSFYLASAVDLFEQVSPTEAYVASGHVSAPASAWHMRGALTGVLALVMKANRSIVAGCEATHEFAMDRG